MPESLAANEKRVIAKAGQVFITPDFTIRAECDVPLVFGARDGGVPWFDQATKTANATAVTSRQRPAKA